jgi:hypothetical protein
MSHFKLGEEVAAAVVLRPGATAGERQLQEFVAGTLADFKVPRRIVLVDEIPKGPTGKPQRIGLEAKLKAQLKPPHVAPRTPAEASWRRSGRARCASRRWESTTTSDVELAQLLASVVRARVRKPSRVVAEIASVARPGQGSYVRSKLKFLERWWTSRSYSPRPYAGDVHAFLTRDSLASRRGPRLDWRRLVTGRFEVHEMGGDHMTMQDEENASPLAAELEACIESALAALSGGARTATG